MADWRDQFTNPRCGYVQIVGENSVEHCYLTDFGYVALDGPPEADDRAFYLKMQKFAHEEWSAGKDGPWPWKGDL